MFVKQLVPKLHRKRCLPRFDFVLFYYTQIDCLVFPRDEFKLSSRSSSPWQFEGARPLLVGEPVLPPELTPRFPPKITSHEPPVLRFGRGWLGFLAELVVPRVSVFPQLLHKFRVESSRFESRQDDLKKRNKLRVVNSRPFLLPAKQGINLCFAEPQQELVLVVGHVACVFRLRIAT
jgi:hypothetical protein